MILTFLLSKLELFSPIELRLDPESIPFSEYCYTNLMIAAAAYGLIVTKEFKV